LGLDLPAPVLARADEDRMIANARRREFITLLSSARAAGPDAGNRQAFNGRGHAAIRFVQALIVLSP
jgi:hypothetical protein